MTDAERDVVVVGAGPAGALTARQLARGGADVLLVDRDVFPRWKVCGACLGGGGRSALSAAGLGDLPRRLGARPVSRFRIRGWGREAVLPVSGSVVISRSALDAALVEAAVAAGVEVCTGWSGSLGAVDGDRRRVVLTGGGSRWTVAARVVVDATGLGGMRWEVDAGLAPVESVAPASRIGVGAVYPAGSLPGTGSGGTVEMAVGPGGYVGIARQEDGSHAVAGALDIPWLRRWGGPGAAVTELLNQAGVTPPRGEPSFAWKGTLPLTRARARRGETRVFTVGDAAGYVEPFTGEGMSWALLGGLELAPLAHQAVAAWTPELTTAWDRRYHRRVGRRQRVCRGVAWLSRRRTLSVAVLTLLERVPELAAPLVRGTASAPARLPSPLADRRP